MPAVSEKSPAPGEDTRHYRTALIAIVPFVLAFLLSNVFRTMPALIGRYWEQDADLGVDAVGTAAASFNIAFAAMQLPLGIALDRFGVGRVQAILLSVAIVGAVVSAFATGFLAVAGGQLLIGLGMAGSLMGGLVYAARNLPDHWFPGVSAAAIAIGSAGMLLSASPLAGLIEAIGWRNAFLVMAAIAGLLAVMTLMLVRQESTDESGARQESIAQLALGVLTVLRQKQVLAVCLLALATYPAAMAIRGLWIGPYLDTGYGLSTVMIGHAASAMSIAMVIGAPLAGWLASTSDNQNRKPLWRRIDVLLVGGTVFSALCLFGPALVGGGSLLVDVAALAGFGFFGAVYALQYTAARTGFPPEMTGRVLTSVNMAFFGGAALMQVWTGLLADYLPASGSVDAFGAFKVVMGATAAFLLLGSVAFSMLWKWRRED